MKTFLVRTIKLDLLILFCLIFHISLYGLVHTNAPFDLKLDKKSIVIDTVKRMDIPTILKDGINYIDTSTVAFSLLAPHKKQVYLLGDFNNWEIRNEYQMNKTPDGERYWIVIENLIKGKEYRFQYLVDGQIRTGDPYSDKVLDPQFDSSIPTETYPNLIPYPTGKTTGHVSVFQTNQTPYSWNVKNFNPPEKDKMVIYELSIRDMVKTHSFKTIKDTLDYIQNLGVNVIELIPVMEFGGNDGWGYNPDYYFAPDKYFGTKNELKSLIDECHKREIAVVLDMVLNHSWGNNPLVKLYYDYTKNWPTPDSPWFFPGPMFAEPNATYGPVYNHGSHYTEQFVDSVNTYWLTEYKFDGFRFDFTKGFVTTFKDMTDPWGDKYDAARIAILKRMADAIWKINPKAYVILEHLVFGYNEEEKELANYGMLLWGNFSYHFKELSKGNSAQLSWMSYKVRNWTAPNVITYMESHDWERVMYETMTNGRYNSTYDTRNLSTALDRMKMNAAFLFTMPGPHMIWLFGELGYNISTNYNGYGKLKPFHWEYFNDPDRRKLYDVYAAIIHLKQKYPVFATRDFGYSTDGITKCFHLNSPEMNVTIIGNYDIISHSINPDFQHTGDWYDFFSGQKMVVKDSHKSILLEPGCFYILIDSPVDFPKKGLVPFTLPGQSTNLENTYQSDLKVFPNPGRGVYHLIFRDNSYSNLMVYDITGKEIFSKSFMASGSTIDLTTNPNGIYLFQIKNKNKSYTLSIIKN